MTLEQIKSSRLLLNKLKELKEKNMVFKDKNAYDDTNCISYLTEAAALVILHLELCVNPYDRHTKLAHVKPFVIDKLIMDMEEFLSVFNEDLGIPFRKNDVLEFHRITGDVYKLIVKRNMFPIDFDEVRSFSFHGGKATILGLIWFLEKVFGLEFSNLQQEGDIISYRVK